MTLFLRDLHGPAACTMEWLSKISLFVAHYQGFPSTQLFCVFGVLLLDMNLREGEL